MSSRSSSERKFRVGDIVRFVFGVTKVEGTIIEDRGPIGVGGRRLYRIRFQFQLDEEPMYIELPAADIEPVSVTQRQIPGGR